MVTSLDDDAPLRVTITADEVTPDGHRVHLEVVGELDTHSAGILRTVLNAVEQSHPAVIVVDLAGVTFLDSAGIGVLVGALRRAADRGGVVCASNPSASVRRVFEITHLATAFGLD